jgi:hypothetical protein
VPEVALLPLAVVDWVWLRKRDGSHCVRDDPPLPIELTLIFPAPTRDWWVRAVQCFGQRGSGG